MWKTMLGTEAYSPFDDEEEYPQARLWYNSLASLIIQGLEL
jgi:hypothetical protein